MSKELILENLKASLELLEQTHNANTISENWRLYEHIGATLKKVEQTALAPYLMDQVVKLVTIACDKRKASFAPKDTLKLTVAVGSVYNDDGYNFGIDGDSCEVELYAPNLPEKISDLVEQDGWDWIYSLDPDHLTPWLRHHSEGIIIITISRISEFYDKIHKGMGSVSKAIFHEHVEFKL